MQHPEQHGPAAPLCLLRLHPSTSSPPPTPPPRRESLPPCSGRKHKARCPYHHRQSGGPSTPAGPKMTPGHPDHCRNFYSPFNPPSLRTPCDYHSTHDLWFPPPFLSPLEPRSLSPFHPPFYSLTQLTSSPGPLSSSSQRFTRPPSPDPNDFSHLTTRKIPSPTLSFFLKDLFLSFYSSPTSLSQP